MGKEYINEVAWSKIYKILKNIGCAYVKNEKKTKLFLEAVFWMMRTGAQ